MQIISKSTQRFQMGVDGLICRQICAMFLCVCVCFYQFEKIETYNMMVDHEHNQIVVNGQILRSRKVPQ